MSKKCKKKKHKTIGSAKNEAKRMAELYGVPYNWFRCDKCGNGILAGPTKNR